MIISVRVNQKLEDKILKEYTDPVRTYILFGHVVHE